MKFKKLFLFFIIIILIIVSGFIGYKHLSNRDNQPKKNIPKVYFEGDISKMTSKKDVRKIKVKYVSDDVNFETYAEIKIQGTSSVKYDKKNYNITLYNKDFTEKNKIDVGFGKQSKYCLKANWIDKTHARNIVTARLASEVNKKYNLLNDTPNNGVIDGYPVEIYINNTFLGLYTWNIPKDSWMFNMDKENENHLVFANEGWTASSLFNAKVNSDAFSIEAGIDNEESFDKLEAFSKFIRKSSNKEFKNNIKKFMDFDAALNYYILVQFAQLNDNVAKNMLLVTYDGKKWYPTLYDLDSSWGTNYDGLSTLNYEDLVVFSDMKLWKRFEQTFSKEIAERYFELRKNILTKEHIMKLFEDFKNDIPNETFEKENQRWENIPGYDYNQIEEFLNIRIPIIDKEMQKLKNS